MDFVFVILSNRPRLNDSKAVLDLIGRYHFSWEVEVGVDSDPSTSAHRLTISGDGWPGAWKVPDGMEAECELKHQGEGREGFEQFLKEVAPLILGGDPVQEDGGRLAR